MGMNHETEMEDGCYLLCVVIRYYHLSIRRLMEPSNEKDCSKERQCCDKNQFLKVSSLQNCSLGKGIRSHSCP